MLTALAGGALYLVIHLAAYAIGLRHTSWVRSERGIFLYHALSAAALTAYGVGAVLADPRMPVVAAAVAVIGLHGLYSLSFLELWSLTEGSYSLSILEHIEGAARTGEHVDLAPLERLGGQKTTQRLHGLRRLGLVRGPGDRITLTHRGRWVADVLGVVASPPRPLCG